MRNAALISLLCFVICKPTDRIAVTVQSENFSHYKLKDTSRYAIFKYNKERDNYYGFDKDSKPATLSTAELIKIEDLISKKVAKYNKSEKKGYTPL